jgi:hypothetical protein
VKDFRYQADGTKTQRKEWRTQTLMLKSTHASTASPRDRRRVFDFAFWWEEITPPYYGWLFQVNGNSEWMVIP